MKLQRLLSLLRQAIDQYQMIENGDHIAIGIPVVKTVLLYFMVCHSFRNFIRSISPCLPLL